MVRIGGGDLPTVVVDPKDANVAYTASTVMWRTLDGGATWSAVRGAPGGDDYQRIWINPNNPDIILAVTDQGAVVSANRGAVWSNWYNQNDRRDVSRHDGQRLSLSRLRRAAGLGQRVRAEPIGRWADHVPRLASGEHPGVRDGRAGSEGPRRRLRQRAQRRLALRPPHRADDASRTRHVRHVARRRRDEPQRADDAARLLARGYRTMFYASERRLEERRSRRTRGHGFRPTSRVKPGRCRPTREVREHASSRLPLGSITALAPSPLAIGTLWAGSDDGNIQVTRDGGLNWTNVTPPSIKPWTRIFNLEAGHFDALTAYAAANTLRLDEINAAFLSHARRRQDVDGDQHGHHRRRRRQHHSRGSAAEGPALCRHGHAGLGVVRRRGSLAVAAAQHAGDLGARSADQGRCEVPLLRI